MFERFSDSARRVVVVAQEEARRLGHRTIGTEHVLLGLLGEGTGLGGTVLRETGLTLDAARADVEEIAGRQEASPMGHIPFTPYAKKLLELSLREALHQRDNYIGTEHILLGLLREPAGVAGQVLERHGVDPDGLRARLAEEAEGRTGRPLGPLGEGSVFLTSGPSFATRLDRIQASLDRIERRLDAFGVPPAPESDGGEGPRRQAE
ncbi:Clp protease [Sphaerisporangium album]|uniref:Clp protease n=1 Tax=Sphaerisporangium album TaxID=509200 RepID=A0A367FGW2_9ACTN|nr:Clp protease [Sphaerisporangium album]